MTSARPTTADVARLANVSTATVSYVLNDVEGHRISERTRDAVYRAAQQLGYRPNLAARNLARGKSGAVLYVVPRVAVGDMPLQAGSRMTTELTRAGLLQVQIFETEDDRHIVDAIENIDPVAVTSLFPLPERVVHAMRTAGIPHIEIGQLPALGNPPESVGQLRIDHLVSRGHREIAFACAGVKRWRALGNYWLGGVIAAAKARELPPICVGDITQANVAEVVTVLYGIREAGLACPDDLAVIGVDAAPIGALSSPPLTTVEFNPTAVADVAVAALLTELKYPSPPPPQPAEITRLIVRAST
jgi:DNA-binding LacI/PurR family transcriptional regulator